MEKIKGFVEGWRMKIMRRECCGGSLINDVNEVKDQISFIE